MKANYLQPVRRAQVSHKAMGNFLMRASVDKRIDERIKEHEAKRWEELNAYAAAVDETMLYTLHEVCGFGAKRLRRVWEAMIRNRIAFRQFYRDGSDEYQEQVTGENVEDKAIVQQLLAIGVDVKAWEAEEIRLDGKTGEVSFGGGKRKAKQWSPRQLREAPFEQLSIFEEDVNGRAEDHSAEGREGQR